MTDRIPPGSMCEWCDKREAVALCKNCDAAICQDCKRRGPKCPECHGERRLNSE